MRPEINRLVEKAMAEPAYLQRLMSNPAEAAREVGVELTEEELAQIRPINLSAAETMLAMQKSAGC